MVHTQYSEPEMPIQDDGWWASVLAEEESRASAPAVKPQKTEEAGKPSTDWGKAGRLYRQDEIISLQVTQFQSGWVFGRRGGLEWICSLLSSGGFAIPG